MDYEQANGGWVTSGRGCWKWGGGRDELSEFVNGMEPSGGTRRAASRRTRSFPIGCRRRKLNTISMRIGTPKQTPTFFLVRSVAYPSYPSQSRVETRF